MLIRTSLLALALLGPLALPAVAQAQEGSVTYYETLSPYGDWVETDSYGRVWRPHQQVVGVEFVPYASGGRWVHTRFGWSFEAQWEWAWLPFHYGRWYEDDLNGWVWVPGDVWAPAWVEWRFGGGYVGWVPSGPPHHPTPRWYFVETGHFAEPHIWEHRATAVSERTVFQMTRSIPPPSGVAYSAGPGVEQIRASSRVGIPERRLDAPPPPLPRGVAMFPEHLPPAPPRPPAPGPGRNSELNTREQPARSPGREPPVPAQAMPASARPGADLQQRPGREPQVQQQAMPPPTRPGGDLRQRAEPNQPIREPSQPGQEPFRPMVEPTPAQGPQREAPMQREQPPAMQPAPVREQRAPPMQREQPPTFQPAPVREQRGPPMQREQPMQAQPQAQPPPPKRPQVQPQQQAPAGPMPEGERGGGRPQRH